LVAALQASPRRPARPRSLSNTTATAIWARSSAPASRREAIPTMASSGWYGASSCRARRGNRAISLRSAGPCDSWDRPERRFLARIHLARRYAGRRDRSGQYGEPGALLHEASRISITVVKRPPTRVKGFIALPKRWVVERTLGWINRPRRL